MRSRIERELREERQRGTRVDDRTALADLEAAGDVEWTRG